MKGGAVLPDSPPRFVTVLMEHLFSAEFAAHGEEPPERVLKDVSLRMLAGECWSVSAPEAYPVRLLLEIMANIHPYEGGRCVLVERGMMRRKRLRLPHVFYAGSPDMFYGTMTALEHMMLCLPRRLLPLDRLDAQERLLDEFEALGLGYTALTPIERLAPEDRAALALFAALKSRSRLVVLNLPDLKPKGRALPAFAALSRALREAGKTLVLGTSDDGLIRAACTHSAFLAEGRVLFQGRTEDLCQAFDPVLVTLWGEDLEALGRRLSLPPGYCLEREGDALHILCRPAAAGDAELVYRKIAEAGVVPRAVETHRKCPTHAFKELMTQSGL